VVWIDGSDFELELESVKAQARSPVAAPNKLEKGWFSRQGLSASCLHSCKRPMELSIMLAPGWQTSPPIGQQCLRTVPSMHVPRRHPNEFSSSNCSRNRTMAREAC
jgi:hypothetical protein